jgi:Na+-translocating ferredoxin:NAD+ oxidoreductase RnfD subunit
MAEALAPSLPPEVPVQLPYAPAGLAAAARPMLWHSGMNLRRFFSLHVMGMMLPIGSALLFYGWRALALMAVMVASTAAGVVVWRRIGARGEQLRFAHSLWLALLLSLMLPVHLMTVDPPFEGVPGNQWAALVGMGFLVATMSWLLGGVGSGRIHPVLVTYLLLVVLFKQMLVPHWVLQRDHRFRGDVAKSERTELAIAVSEGWMKTPASPGSEALYEDPASEKLFRFTSGQQRPDRTWLSLDGLLRDEMPPLEDLIIGGQPGPLAASAIAIIVGGLFLLYRGVIDFRIPLLIYLSAFGAMLVLRVPAVIKEAALGPHIDWRWLALRDHDIGPAKAITFANYEIMAGPLLFMAFYLATAPAVRPMTRRARVIYGLLIGAVAAVFQLYLSVSYGPYLALLLVSLLTPTFDRMFKPKPLV